MPPHGVFPETHSASTKGASTWHRDRPCYDQRVLTRESVGAAFPSQQHKEIITKFGSRIGDARVVEAKGLSGAFDRRTLRQSNAITNYREVPGRDTFRTAVVSSTESDYDTDSVTLFDY